MCLRRREAILIYREYVSSTKRSDTNIPWICVFDEKKRWIRIYREYVSSTKGNNTLYIVNMCLRRRKTMNHTLRSFVLASITAKLFDWESQKLRFTLRSFELASNLTEEVSNFDIRYEASNSFICSTYMTLIDYDFYKKKSLKASKKRSLKTLIFKEKCWNFRCDLIDNLCIHSTSRSFNVSEFRRFRIFDLSLIFFFLWSFY